MIKLLVVDDEKGLCEYLRDFFKPRGYWVFTPTPESPALQSGDEWLSGSEFRPPKERRNSKEEKPRDLSRESSLPQGERMRSPLNRRWLRLKIIPAPNLTPISPVYS
jgi:hypothetical protein